MTPLTSLKLYLLPGSSSMFPHILLRYCDLSFTPIPVTLSSVQSTTYPNAKQQVPVLMLDDDTMITENPAIALAISQLAPAKNILGSTPLETVRVTEWMAWIAGPLHAQAWAAYMRPFRFISDVDSEVAVEGVKEAAKRKCLARFEALEDGLSPQGPWALGERFTAVDAYVFVFWNLAEKVMGLEMGERYPRWTRVVDELMGLECVKEMLKFEEEVRLKQ